MLFIMPAKVEHDTAEVREALDNLRSAYHEAESLNSVVIRYLDIEPPCSGRAGVIMSTSRALRIAAHLPENLWPEPVMAATYPAVNLIG